MRLDAALLCAAVAALHGSAAQQNFTVSAPRSDSRIASSAYTHSVLSLALASA